MIITNFSDNNLDEVVFEHRNKLYGAYAIRKCYQNHLNKAIAFTLLPLILMLVFCLVQQKNVPETIYNSNKSAANIDNKINEVAVQLDNLMLVTNTNTENNNYVVVKNKKVPQKALKQNAQTSTASRLNTSAAGLANTNFAGSGNGLNISNGNTVVMVEPNLKIEDFAEIMPSFPGGLDLFYQYISKNINYPRIALENGIHGKVVVSFVVYEDGSIADVTLERGIGFGCDEEAMRIVNAMPNWLPAMQNGKKVAVKMRLPIKFQVN